MSNKCIFVYLHLIWATWDRERWIVPEIERQVYRMILSAIKKLDCPTLIINGMPDHVHVLIKQKTNVTIADIVKRAKGSSSRLINQTGLMNNHFKWGIGYGAFSVSRWDTDKIKNYIRNQKEHHKSGHTIEDLENTPFKIDS